MGDFKITSKVKGSVDSVQVCEWSNGRVGRPSDRIVSEEPLEIRVGDFSVSVTMRTPGSDYELALGFLFTEGLMVQKTRFPTCGNRQATAPRILPTLSSSRSKE